jgi:hypothetical protein
MGSARFYRVDNAAGSPLGASHYRKPERFARSVYNLLTEETGRVGLTRTTDLTLVSCRRAILSSPVN